MEKLQEEEGGENDLTMLFQEEMKRCVTPGVTVAPAVSATSRNPSKSLEIPDQTACPYHFSTEPGKQ